MIFAIVMLSAFVGALIGLVIKQEIYLNKTIKLCNKLYEWHKQDASLIKNLEENAKNKRILDALKKHLHVLPMSNGDLVIAIGNPSDEDVIEPNDFGYEIIMEWLIKDEGE